MTAAPPTHPDKPTAKPYVPSEAAVEALAASLFAQNTGQLPDAPAWSDLPKIARLPWRTMAMTGLVAAGEQIVVSALSHVTTNREQYGFTKDLADQLTFAQYATDMHSDLEAMLAEAAEESSDSDQDA